MEAENNGEKGFGKILGKRITRAKEKVLQKFGKADETTDNEFDQLVDAFGKQQGVAYDLQKEFKNYTAQVKAMSLASHSMYQALSDSYEDTWKNADKFLPAVEQLVHLSENHLSNLNEKIQAPLADYNRKFADFKTKISKRGRKMTDYDSARHYLESLENAKKRDETKISKAHQDLNAAKLIYESIHNELCEELPELYKSRVPELCGYISTLLSAEALLQSESAKIKTELLELVELKSGRETAVRKPTINNISPVPPRPPVVQRSVDLEKTPIQDDENQQNVYLTLVEMGVDNERNRITSESSEDDDDDGRKHVSQQSLDNSANGNTSATRGSLSSGGFKTASDRELNLVKETKSCSLSNSSIDSIPKNLQQTDKPMENILLSSQSSDINENKEKEKEKVQFQEASDEVQEGKASRDSDDRKSVSSVDKKLSVVDVSDNKAESASNFLYQVVAIHSYTAEDGDELGFDKGDVIDVLPFEENSEEQDEGWLLGVKSSTGEKGVFPLNFTSKM